MFPSDLNRAVAAERRDDLLRAAARERRTRAGYPVVVRRATAADRHALRRFLTRLSPGSTFQRFLGGGFRANDAVLDVLLRHDGTGMAAVAVAGSRIVGHAMWAPASGAPRGADLGVVVSEAFRGQGVATRLLQAVVADAASRGIALLEAVVLAENEPVHRMIRRRWPDATSVDDHGVVEYRVAVAEVAAVLPPVEVRAAATRADRDSLRRFLEGLSGPTAMRRFLGPGFRVSGPMLDLLLVEGLPGTAMVAVEGQRVVGHVVWTPVPSVGGAPSWPSSWPTTGSAAASEPGWCSRPSPTPCGAGSTRSRCPDSPPTRRSCAA